MNAGGERSSDNWSEAVRRRIDFERLFGLEEVYVGRKRGAKDEATAEEVGDAGRPAGDTDDALERRKAAVAAARERARGRRAAAKSAAASAAAKPDDGAASAAHDFTIEELPGSNAEESLLSEAERAGVPHVSGMKCPAAGKLAALREAACECSRCELAEVRNEVVFGEGDPEAKLVFVGEAPGADEDRTGRPFVGRAGKLLTKIIEAMGLAREDVYICNVLKCRPPGNRTPAAGEITACSPYLHEQLAAIAPKAICTLGGPASQTLLATKTGITRLRGRLFWYRGIPLMPTFHPAYLLRNPREKKPVWADMQKLVAFMATRG